MSAKDLGLGTPARVALDRYSGEALAVIERAAVQYVRYSRYGAKTRLSKRVAKARGLARREFDVFVRTNPKPKPGDEGRPEWFAHSRMLTRRDNRPGSPARRRAQPFPEPSGSQVVEAYTSDGITVSLMLSVAIVLALDPAFSVSVADVEILAEGPGGVLHSTQAGA